MEGLDAYRGHSIKLLAKNENYVVRYMERGVAGAGAVDGAVMACTPDLICVVDSETGTVTHTNVSISECCRRGLVKGAFTSMVYGSCVCACDCISWARGSKPT